MDDIESVFTFLLLFVFVVGMTVLSYNFFATLDTSGWSFFGSAFVISLLPILPFTILIVGLLIPLYFIMEARE
jgi:uncharacterized transporter YbjL